MGDWCWDEGCGLYCVFGYWRYGWRVGFGVGCCVCFGWWYVWYVGSVCVEIGVLDVLLSVGWFC